MKNIKLIIAFLLLIFSVGSQTNQYLWIDYNVKLPIKIQSADTYSVTIPCQTRIGDCQAEYSIVPPNWWVKKDGTLVFPQSEARAYGIYAVKATFSNDFEDRLTADLVCTINNGVFRIYDKSKFMKSNGFDQASSASKQIDTPSIVPEIKYDIEGFPTVKQLENLIKNGNIYTISQKLKQISQKYAASCKAKVGYLNQAYIILKKKISQNQKIIKNYEDQINLIKNRIGNLEEQRKNIDKDLNNDRSYAEMKSNLKKLSTKREQLQSNLDKLNFLADRYLSNMYKGTDASLNQTNQEIQLSQLEEEMRAIDKIIQDAVQKKKKLQEQINDKKSKIAKPVKISKQKEAQLMAVYEKKYRQYSQKALQARVQLSSIEQQISSITSKFNIKNAPLSTNEQQISEQMNKLAEYQSSTAVKAQEEQMNINQIFKLSADNIKSKINMLTSSQCSA